MTATTDTYMRASDAFTWYMERDPALRSTVVAVDWLDRAPDWGVLTERVDRLSRLMPSLRQHVVESPFGLTVPRWAYDPHFDLDWHLSRVTVPPPGTREEVLGLARHAAMAAFDRARPLWEVTLVEGMEDGEAALIVKLHHALSDGVGVMRMLAVVADRQREPADLGEMPAGAGRRERQACPAWSPGPSARWPGKARAWPGWRPEQRSRPRSASSATRPDRPAAPWRWPVRCTGRRRRTPPPCRPSCGNARRLAISPRSRSPWTR